MTLTDKEKVEAIEHEFDLYDYLGREGRVQDMGDLVEHIRKVLEKTQIKSQIFIKCLVIHQKERY